MKAKFCEGCGRYMWLAFCDCGDATEEHIEKWSRARLGQYGMEFEDEYTVS